MRPPQPPRRSTPSGGNSPLRRDRHGKGLRGPLAPSYLPFVRSRAQRFDDLVLDAVERLEHTWARQLAGVEFAVEDVPPVPAAGWDGWSEAPVPLSRLLPPAGTRPPRIVVYRHPLEVRAVTNDDLGALVHDAVVEEVAHLLGLDPETVDPSYAERNG